MNHFNMFMSLYENAEHAAKFTGRYYILQDYVMRPEVFNAVMREWRRLEDLSQLKSHDPFNCPACGDTPHCVHIDGNAKLYRYEKAGG